MAHMKDLYLVGFDGVKNQIGIVPHLPDADIWIIRLARYEGEIAKQIGIDLDLSLDALSGERVVVGDVGVDIVEICLRRNSVADFHTPCRLKNAAISSSLTNSPRFAASRPRLTAARSSSLSS